jgi:hypothetical protein
LGAESGAGAAEARAGMLARAMTIVAKPFIMFVVKVEA